MFLNYCSVISNHDKMYHNNEFFCLCLLWLLISTQKCQVAVAPGCRSGYEGNDNTRIHFFAFPDAEKYSDERVRWINKVPRLNWNPGKKTNIKLCHKHFRPDDITYESNDKRRKRAVPLQRPW